MSFPFDYLLMISSQISFCAWSPINTRTRIDTRICVGTEDTTTVPVQKRNAVLRSICAKMILSPFRNVNKQTLLVYCLYFVGFLVRPHLRKLVVFSSIYFGRKRNFSLKACFLCLWIGFVRCKLPASFAYAQSKGTWGITNCCWIYR